MKTVAKHEVLKTPNGDLALMLDVLSFDEGQNQAVLVSRDADKAYLRRAPGDIYEISGINPDIINDARKAKNIIVLETLGEKIIHSYDVPSGILEED